MARKPRILIPGGIYHVTSRGNERQAIFRDNRNRFCLMPNHFHLLVKTPKDNLDRFMGSLLTGYTVYFNLRHQRVGQLMQMKEWQEKLDLTFKG